MHIGILEDDLDLLQKYEVLLKGHGHTCQCYTEAAAFIKALGDQKFDLLLIDRILPESSGDAVLLWVRKNIGWLLPIIFVTSCDTEKDIVDALQAGADDYLVKPPRLRELLARIDVLTRHVKASPILEFGKYKIDPNSRQISLAGKMLKLTQKEFELANYLFQNLGNLLSREHLLEQLWGLNGQVDTRTLDTHISRIRSKLEIGPVNGCQIFPVYAWGYRMERVELGAA
jgi:two-component system response regulator RegX3